MKNKNSLDPSIFRYLNEQFHEKSARKLIKHFGANRSEFKLYHSGFKQQVTRWPSNPLNKINQNLRSDFPERAVVADLGCGEAFLARSNRKNKKYEFHNFDLFALNEFVKVCDSAKTPLARAQVDAAVFSLSLCGKKYFKSLVEANRILKMGGRLYIAEVRSRVNEKEFLSLLADLGFELGTKVVREKMFLFFKLEKTRDVLSADLDKKTLKNKAGLALRSVKYRKR